MKTDRQIVDEATELARRLAKADGWSFSPGMRFHDPKNPRAYSYWRIASIAYEHIEGTPIDDALTGMQDEIDALEFVADGI